MSKGRKIDPKVSMPANPKNPGIAEADKCLYCGKKILREAPPFLAKAHTRQFPVCSEECRDDLERYVGRDKQQKKFFYIGLMVCAVLILVGSIMGEAPALIFLGVIVAGLDLLLWPYPITSFETFFSCPIKRVTQICRILGVVFVVLGIFFMTLRMIR